MILLEASSKKQKTYKCPYCEYRAVKEKLISHIADNHDDMIPEGFTPSRIVFNIINKKDHGTCIECKGESPWNEDKCRYDRLCGKMACDVSYKKKVESRIKNIYGKTSKELLKDPNQQTKMLANRRISGVYRWNNGDLKTYTGEYERKTLEFCEAFGFKSEDVITPGPVVEYMYNGEKHLWITDILIAPYNLAIDCKDGGDNPNKRPMKEYREKQIAKEKAIAKDGKYNYLRLTDNNFKQLIEVLTLLKLQLIEDNKSERIIKINEEMFASMSSFMPPANTKNNYIINYSMNNTFSDSKFAITDDIKMTNLIIQDDDGVIRKESTSFLENCTYNIYRLNEDIDITYLKSMIGKKAPYHFIYESIFNNSLYTSDQIVTENVTEVIDYYSYLDTIRKIVESYLLYGDDSLYVPRVENYIYEDKNGFFLMNEETKLRTPYRKDKNFTILEYSIIERGVIG